MDGCVSKAVARRSVPALSGGLIGPLDTVILAARPAPATAAAPPTPTAATITVYLASALTFAGFAGVATEFARRLANGGGPLFVAAARCPLVVAASWRPIVVAAARRPIIVAAARRPIVVAAARCPIVVAASWRPCGPCARVVIRATALVTADFPVGRLLRISLSGRVSGGGFRCRPRGGAGSRAWGGPRFG